MISTRARLAMLGLAVWVGTFMAPAHAEQSLVSLYTQHCSGCHGTTGNGVPAAGIPDLHDAGAYIDLPAGRAYLVQVPGLSQSRLDNATAARMLNYVLSRFAADRLPRDFHPYTAAEIARLRTDTASDAETRRVALLAMLRGSGGPTTLPATP
jgi:mono/diheme cytochrome c family protein